MKEIITKKSDLILLTVLMLFITLHHLDISILEDLFLNRIQMPADKDQEPHKLYCIYSSPKGNYLDMY